MSESTELQSSVFQSHDPRACREMKLVLDAAGIACQVQRAGSGHHALIVNAADGPRAESEIEAYRAENRSRTNTFAAVLPTGVFAVEGVVFYVVVIFFIGAVSLDPRWGIDLYTPGEMQSQKVTSGDWWRSVTALTLHLDFGHLISNILFGSLFGYFASRALGGGLAWLTIVVAGALGNLANAFIQPPEHTSIGASTAVFAALGMLVAHGLRPRKSKSESLMRRWTPLVGGLMLFSLTGVGGERTDVMAHLTGFASGFAAGWIVRYASEGLISNQKFQAILGVLAAGIIGLAWTVALR